MSRKKRLRLIQTTLLIFGLLIIFFTYVKRENNFSENIISDFQIAIDRVHPVQISSRSDNCITTHIM